MTEIRDSIFSARHVTSIPRELAGIAEVAGDAVPMLVCVDPIDHVATKMPVMRFLCAVGRENIVDHRIYAKIDDIIYIFAHVYTDDGVLRFACFGTPYSSQDGEYRSQFVTWTQVRVVLAEFAPFFDKLESRVVSLMRSKGIKISAPDESVINISIVRLFCVWMHIAMWLSTQRGREPHATAASDFFVWNDTLRSIWNATVAEIQHFTDAHSGWTDTSHGKTTDINGMLDCAFVSSRVLFSGIRANLCGRVPVSPMCGQKLIPLTDLEWENHGDINFPAWREMFIANICSNLAADRIACGFGFIAGWFYLRDVGEEIFVNPAIHERFRNSVVAGRMMDEVNSADNMNYRETGGEPINAKFAKMSHKLLKAFEYARGSIHYSGNALCAILEDVGLTWGTAIPALFDKEYYKSYINVLGKTCESVFMDILWDFDVMNKQLGVVHADCHVNNATLKYLTGASLVEVDPENPPHDEIHAATAKVAYRFGEITYLADYSRLTPYIIDFSRSLIFDIDRISREFSPRYAEIFAKNQRDRIMSTIVKYLPEFIRDGKYIIEARILSDLPEVGRALSAVDAYNFFGGLTITLDNYIAARRAGKPGNRPEFVKIDPIVEAEHYAIFERASVLANRISATAHDVLVANMHALVRNDFGNVLWGNEVVFTKVFAKHKMNDIPVTATNHTPIVAAYSTSRKLISDVRELATWPKESDPAHAMKYIEALAVGGVHVPARKHADDNDEIAQWLRRYNIGSDSPLAKLAESSWV